ncbi:MAG: hypothetical protein ACYCTF_12870, partial [Acidiferrobacter sp.]
MVGQTKPSLNTTLSLKKLLLPMAIAASLSACVSGGGSASSSPTPSTQSSNNTTATSTTTPITGSTIPLGLALNTPGAGTGQTYYVATTGSDSNNGLSPQTP